MPEANALYTVTAVVVAGLAVWVLAALKMAKEPWARPAAASTSSARAADVPIEKTDEPAPEEKAEPPAQAEEKSDEPTEEKA